MAFSTRSLSGHLRQGSASGNIASQSTGQSSALQARINEKKAELENLRELRDLSAAVANQMEALETKLSTLSDGTEGMATKREFQSRMLANMRNSNCNSTRKLAQCVTGYQHGVRYSTFLWVM